LVQSYSRPLNPPLSRSGSRVGCKTVAFYLSRRGGEPSRRNMRVKEWSDWGERHGRWAGSTTREECLAVERCGKQPRSILLRIGLEAAALRKESWSVIPLEPRHSTPKASTPFSRPLPCLSRSSPAAHELETTDDDLEHEFRRPNAARGHRENDFAPPVNKTHGQSDETRHERISEIYRKPD